MTPLDLTATLPPQGAPGTPAERSIRRSVEVPTLLLIFATYGSWLAVTLAYGHWPLIIVAALTAALITLHSSIQHEVVHGHPTRWLPLNHMLAMVPLSLWLPFERYRRSHRAHHIDARLTDPVDDPESYYWVPEDWQRLRPLTRWVLELQQSLAGRLIIGPFWSIGRFLRGEFYAVTRNEGDARSLWTVHLLWCVPVILWVKVMCGIPLTLYFFAMAVPASALLLIRSFAEHRATSAVRERIAIVESSWILGPLYLFNNLHSLHHESPHIPWYEYHSRYRASRERLIAANGGLVYRNYFQVARRYLFRAHDNPIHPTGRVPAPST